MLRKTLLKAGLIIASAAMLVSVKAYAATEEDNDKVTMKSAKEVVSEMGVGWNLGNTLDSHGDWIYDYCDGTPSDFETSWGNPVTTKAMIDKVKEGGFKTIRIPVTWRQHMGQAPSYTVDEAWMNRVNEVVDYAIDNGLYVILNIHHEEEWCIPTLEKEEECTEKLTALWNQIATRFEKYDSHLIFETLNEPRLIGSPEEWGGGTSEGRKVVADYNEAALKTIRSTGGNNAKRAVMMPTYGATGAQIAREDFRVPEDPNVIVSLHSYSPYFFAMTASGTNKWGTEADKLDLEAELTGYYRYFRKKGMQVVIGEFGTISKENVEARVEHAKSYIEIATKLGIPCVWWDNGYYKENEDNSFQLLDRKNLTWTFPEIKDALIDTYKKAYEEAKNDDTPKDDVLESSKDLSLAIDKREWPGGYQLNFSITNTSDKPVTGWTLKIKKGRMKVIGFWNANMETEGDYLVITPAPWSQTIAPNTAYTFGMCGEGMLDVLQCKMEQ